jgi:outer membrane protein TolC
VLQLDAEGRATAAAVAAADSDRQRARERRAMGLATDADVLAIEVHLARMRQRQIAAAADLEVARAELAVAVGLPLDTAIEPVRPPARTSSEQPVTGAAIAMHPRLREAQAQVQLAANAERAARARFLPTAGVQAAWEFNGETPAAQRSSWIVGAEIRVNLFRGFADSARMAEARHARLRADAERDRAERSIEIDIRRARAQLAAARATEEAGRVALAQAREAQRIIRDRYDGGLATVTDVLRAAEATLDAESRATAAETSVILRDVELERALGHL